MTYFLVVTRYDGDEEVLIEGVTVVEAQMSSHTTREEADTERTRRSNLSACMYAEVCEVLS